MNELATIIGVIIAIIVSVVVASVPFAFLGWCLVTFLSLFGDFSGYGWWGYAAVGLATSALLGLITSLDWKW